MQGVVQMEVETWSGRAEERKKADGVRVVEKQKEKTWGRLGIVHYIYGRTGTCPLETRECTAELDAPGSLGTAEAG
ncbi:hypothetical protein PICMEDRAFT_15035 [Pichia membranifaciens NRRL Y-2026]|uniref:Uncharacterized protein n=1 Tax=Pichia membranifaciens NRRL Y-2026 TaxID=763406 RepID=A0A1E3NLM7_9ASCO|nr:hypothetical protein PICMEDRAFT_15035 [Pichia membranifaciens NRRL Y-2026]ODQ47034.1 hypothetical protein PICMEDRAFT_15035 [Pichia membranifaciens NRRL Y-2026]